MHSQRAKQNFFFQILVADLSRLRLRARNCRLKRRYPSEKWNRNHFDRNRTSRNVTTLLVIDRSLFQIGFDWNNLLCQLATPARKIPSSIRMTSAAWESYRVHRMDNSVQTRRHAARHRPKCPIPVQQNGAQRQSGQTPARGRFL